MKLKTKIVKRWKAETPKVYKRIRNTCVAIGTTMPMLAGISSVAPNIHTPEMIERPHLAMLASIWYWKHNNLSPIALSDEFQLLTKKINGGLNGYTSRLAYYIKAKKILNIE